MTKTILCEAVVSVPFTLNFVEKLDKALYDEAIQNLEIIKQSYDPETQTSNISIYAGTNLTYSDTTTGIWPLQSIDDNRQSDT
jgi:hypothetical protein